MTHSQPATLVVFSLDEQQFALDVRAVERVIRAVEISPLPGAPPTVRGVVNVEGRIVPVIDLRVRFGRSERALRLDDHFIIAHTGHRIVALMADTALGVVPAESDEVVAAPDIIPGIDGLEGVLKLNGNMVFIHDLHRFLSEDDHRALEEALRD
jgi:purine-binding chemotaxis protein CheW